MAYRAGSAESIRSNKALLSSSQKESPKGIDWLPTKYVAGDGMIGEERRRKADGVERGEESRASVDSLGLFVDLDGELDRKGKDIGVEGREFF